MQYEYVGVTPCTLASGRPLVFGDVVDDSDLAPEDEYLASLLPTAPAPEASEPSTSNPEAI